MCHVSYGRLLTKVGLPIGLTLYYWARTIGTTNWKENGSLGRCSTGANHKSSYPILVDTRHTYEVCTQAHLRLLRTT